VEDRFAKSVWKDDPFFPTMTSRFQGWLKGMKRGIKRFLLRTAGPDGPLERVIYQSVPGTTRDLSGRIYSGVGGRGLPRR